MEDILTVSGVSKSFSNFHLDKASFSIKENCITGFLGKNGAGKTTLIKIILDLIKKDGGKITFFSGKFKNDSEAIKNRIGVVLDDGFYYDTLTLNEMKNLIASSYKYWDDKKYKKFLDRFGLNPKQSISTLSKGMKLKYSLALALSHEADLLIMDEPTSGLDPKIRKELMEILLEFVEEKGKSAFFSTHITSDLERCADEIIIINNGKIIKQSSKDDLIDSYRIVKGTLKDLESIKKEKINMLHKTNYGFTGITSDFKKIKIENPNIVIERATLEDIFLSIVEEG
ncbi:ABC transporter ATP-binding protein [Clostridium cochlearium]|uniref:ABC transporter ATP-binding protein n=1 Tax=Clostridium cochlearium TaxID=1494 RepID=UPI001459D592|nr:ABC transporter ATP-binding protein [Clostridium cochlearium]NME96413.1 ABC transporter ATP-binding protein [Clostridium cochlearium]